MFSVKYLTMYEVYNFLLVDYPPVHTQKPYNNLHLNFSLLIKKIYYGIVLSECSLKFSQPSP